MPYAIGQGGVIESRFGGPSHRRLGFPYWGQTRTGRWLVGVRGSVRALSGHCRTGQSWLRPLALSPDVTVQDETLKPKRSLGP